MKTPEQQGIEDAAYDWFTAGAKAWNASTAVLRRLPPVFMLQYTSTDLIYAPLHYYSDKAKAEKAAAEANLTLRNRMASMGKEMKGEVVVQEIHGK